MSRNDPSRRGPTRRTRALLASTALLLLVGPGLAACGADSDQSSDAGAPAPARVDRAGEGSGKPAEFSLDDKAGSGAADVATAPAAQARQVIRTAALTVEVDDITAAAAAVRALGTSLGGLVASEKSQRPDPDDDPETRSDAESVIELRVPEPRLNDAMDRLAALGHERGRTMTSEDVTAQIADLDGRIATQRGALVRVRQLLGRAASVKEIVELEADLTRREADLEGLQRRVAALRGQAELSSVTVTLIGHRAPNTATEPDEPRTGFVGGLKSGWDALTATFVVVSAVVGALLPWMVPSALVAAVVVLIRRRRSARTTS